MTETPIATVFSGGRKFLLRRSRFSSLSYFGGPGCDGHIKAPRHGPRRLHHILTLNHGQFGIRALRFGFKASFYYGLCFEGCEMEWQRTATAAICITRMEPRKSPKEYPYFGYPDVLPYFPLEIMDQSDASAEDVEEAIANTGWDVAPERVYVVVHSHPDMGIALIAPDADVDIVFEYDTNTGIIRAASQAE